MQQFEHVVSCLYTLVEVPILSMVVQSCVYVCKEALFGWGMVWKEEEEGVEMGFGVFFFFFFFFSFFNIVSSVVCTLG